MELGLRGYVLWHVGSVFQVSNLLSTGLCPCGEMHNSSRASGPMPQSNEPTAFAA